jgi:hypothetical protein
VYPAKEYDANPVMNLLAFAPLHDETNLTAENHANFIEAALKWYSLSADRLFLQQLFHQQGNRKLPWCPPSRMPKSQVQSIC